MSGQRGRPRITRAATIHTFGEVFAYLDEHPDASGSEIARELRIRKSDALRMAADARALRRRFPKSETTA